MKIENILNIIAAVAFYAIAPLAQAQCPQICDTAENTGLGAAVFIDNTSGINGTAVGYNALYFNTSGSANTAIGWKALLANGTGSANTGVGALALSDIMAGSNNTAIGYEAMLFTSSGNNNTAVGWLAMAGVFPQPTGSNNTAMGYQALGSYTTGSSNVASGYDALYFNTTGNFNTATGRGALYHNTTASNNVAMGYQALNSNKTGIGNTATGTQALQADTGSNNTADGYQAMNKNTVGADNVATGYQALLANTSGITNTAVGAFALLNSQTGFGNIAIGFNAGTGVTSGGNNIDIANTAANESSTIRIGSSNQTNTYVAGISGVTVPNGIGVIIDSSGHLGTSTSSARYKENIQPMDKASEAILALHPVTFRYKKELDPKAIPQFGLVAEQVEKVDPDLVARDSDGKPYSVRYEAVNAMLLNEFLKEHRKNEQQEIRIGEQQKEIDALKGALQQQAVQIQKVSAQISMTRPAPRLVDDNQ